MARAKHGWHTPETLAGDEICRPLFLPANEEVLAIVGGALAELTKRHNFEEVGAVTPAEITEQMTAMLERWYTDECGGTGGIPTPFWDEVTETDDEATPAAQTWYGSVVDPFESPENLTFVEDAVIWAFAGVLALSGLVGAAIAFRTFAPSFTLAMRGDDFGEVIRILIDGEDYVTVQTSGDPDELIEVPVVGNPDLTTHDLLIILQEIL